MKGKWTRQEQPMSSSDQIHAVRLWKQGRDTFDIARVLKAPEWQIYNCLPKWRKEWNPA